MTCTTGPLGIRWTMGDVSARGFEALRLSIWGGWKAFGPDAAYVVCVNTVTCEEARDRIGPVPDAVVWRPASDIPGFLREHLEAGMAEGVAWKFAPLRCFPDLWELSLDNDCIAARPAGFVAAPLRRAFCRIGLGRRSFHAEVVYPLIALYGRK